VQLRIDLVGASPSDPPALAQDLKDAFQHAGRTPAEGALEVRTTELTPEGPASISGELSALVTLQSSGHWKLLAALKPIAVQYLKNRSVRQMAITSGSTRIALESQMSYQAIAAAITRLDETDPAPITTQPRP